MRPAPPLFRAYHSARDSRVRLRKKTYFSLRLASSLSSLSSLSPLSSLRPSLSLLSSSSSTVAAAAARTTATTSLSSLHGPSRGVRSAPRPAYRAFYSDSTNSMASKIDGTAIAKSIRAGLKTEIEQIQQSNPRFKPSLVIYQSMLIPLYHPPSYSLYQGLEGIQTDQTVGERSDSSEYG